MKKERVRFAYEFIEVRPRKEPREFQMGKIPNFKEKTMVTCTDCEQPKHPLTICYSHYCIQRRRLEGNQEKKTKLQKKV